MTLTLISNSYFILKKAKAFPLVVAELEARSNKAARQSVQSGARQPIRFAFSISGGGGSDTIHRFTRGEFRERVVVPRWAGCSELFSRLQRLAFYKPAPQRVVGGVGHESAESQQATEYDISAEATWSTPILQLEAPSFAAQSEVREEWREATCQNTTSFGDI